jgi:hypothetical protein
MLELNHGRLNPAICATNSKPSFLLLEEIEKIVAGRVHLMLMHFQCAYEKHIEDVTVNKLMYFVCMYRVRLG